MRFRPLEVSLVPASPVISYHQRKAESNGANCESGSGIIRSSAERTITLGLQGIQDGL
jgi:hypothetical protein